MSMQLYAYINISIHASKKNSKGQIKSARLHLRMSMQLYPYINISIHASMMHPPHT